METLTMHMLQRLLRLYGIMLPSQMRDLLRRYTVTLKRLLSRGIIPQDGFVLAKTLDQTIAFVLVRDGCYEPHLSALLRQHLREGDIFVDVGANIGYFTLLAAACVVPKGHVHSFEPNPRTFEVLRRNVALNRFSQVTLNDLALSNQAGTLQLYIGPEYIDSGLASMRQTSQSLSETVVCQSITLDEYVANKGIGKIRAVKLDIEGAELLALQGSCSLLDSPNKPDLIALEAIYSHAAAFGISTVSVAQFLAEREYELNQLIEQPDGLFRLVALEPHNQPPDGTIVAISREYSSCGRLC